MDTGGHACCGDRRHVQPRESQRSCGCGGQKRRGTAAVVTRNGKRVGGCTCCLLSVMRVWGRRGGTRRRRRQCRGKAGEVEQAGARLHMTGSHGLDREVGKGAVIVNDM